MDFPILKSWFFFPPISYAEVHWKNVGLTVFNFKLFCAFFYSTFVQVLVQLSLNSSMGLVGAPLANYYQRLQTLGVEDSKY